MQKKTHQFFLYKDLFLGINFLNYFSLDNLIATRKASDQSLIQYLEERLIDKDISVTSEKIKSEYEYFSLRTNDSFIKLLLDHKDDLSALNEHKIFKDSSVIFPRESKLDEKTLKYMTLRFAEKCDAFSVEDFSTLISYNLDKFQDEEFLSRLSVEERISHVKIPTEITERISDSEDKLTRSLDSTNSSVEETTSSTASTTSMIQDSQTSTKTADSRSPTTKISSGKKKNSFFSFLRW